MQPPLNPPHHQRPIKSYAQRQGRTSVNQQQILANYAKQYPLTLVTSTLNLDQLFGRCAPRHLEIGFGNGETLLAMAKQNPTHDFLGIEVFRSGVAQLLSQAHIAQISNIRVLIMDAVPLLDTYITDQAFASAHIFFADPWPKKRHHKRRLVNHKFIDLLHQKLTPSGQLFLATDWQSYAEQMLALLSQHHGFRNNDPQNGFAQRPTFRPMTKFEQRGLALGHGIWDLAFIRQ